MPAGGGVKQIQMSGIVDNGKTFTPLFWNNCCGIGIEFETAYFILS
jgi:hypothetical protein